MTRDRVLEALSGVLDPELGKDLVSLGMVRDVAVDDGRVSLTIVLTTPACPLRERIETDARAAVMAVPGVTEVTIRFGAEVPRDARLAGRIQVGVKNAIAVGSGKGGVGKSTVAVNLAAALARDGASVGLLDADVYGPNVPMMMGVRHGRLGMTGGRRIAPVEAHGVKLMSIGFLVDEGTPVVWRGPMLHTAIRQFLSDVDWGDLDYLVIDLPPGTGDVQITLSQALPMTGAVVVTTPQAVAMTDVTKAVAMFQLPDVGIPVLGVVENMSGFVAPDTGQVYDIFGRGGGRAIAEKMGVPYLGEVPIDPLLRLSGDEGTPLVLSHPESAAGAALAAVARRLAAAISVANAGDSARRAAADAVSPQ